jgi:hypothetical protein
MLPGERKGCDKLKNSGPYRAERMLAHASPNSRLSVPFPAGQATNGNIGSRAAPIHRVEKHLPRSCQVARWQWSSFYTIAELG